MPPPPSPHPGNATLSEALAIARSGWAQHLDLMFRGSYSFWLGSGISRARFDSLDGLLRTLLCELQARSNDALDCPYRRALVEVIQRTSIDVATIDFSQTPASWPRLDEIVSQLVNQYASSAISMG